MDSIVRGLVVYAVLLLIFRVAGKRSLAQITTFDAVLLLIISEALQQAMIDNDNSMTNALLIVLTMLGADILVSHLTIRSTKLDNILNDVPLVLIDDGRPLEHPMKKSRVSEDDIMERARILHGIERMDQIKYAILERGGDISIIPRYVAWANPASNGSAEPLPQPTRSGQG